MSFGPVYSCTCPITKPVTVNFTGSNPAPSNGYIVGYREAGTTDPYVYVVPNPTSSPVTITNVPVCEDIEVVVQSQCDNSQVSSPQTTTITAYPSYVCTEAINGSHTHAGFYIYPDYLLDVRGATETVNLSIDVIGLPNKFSVYDANNNLVASSTSIGGNVSGWLGIAAYPGPWGSSSLSAPTTGTLSFDKNNQCFFRLRVESQTNSETQDAFQVNIACPTTSNPVVPTIEFVSCSNGSGQYRIAAPATTTMKIRLTATANILNTAALNGWCARLIGSITSSTGPTDSESSATVSSTVTGELKTIGANNSLFVDVTTPGVGYFVVNTQVSKVNSNVTDGNEEAEITIFEVNGTVLQLPISQDICIGTTTGFVTCDGTGGGGTGGGGTGTYDCVNGQCLETVGGAYPDFTSCSQACSGSGGGEQE